MTEIDSLNEAFSFWDKFAYVTLAAVFVGVVGEAILDFTSWVPAERHSKFGKLSVLLLIAGLGGEIIAHAKNNEYSAKITGLLNRQAGEAHERASSADERSKILEVQVEKLKADNLVAAAKIIDLTAGQIDLTVSQKTQGEQVTTVETKVVTVETRVDKVEHKVGDVEAKFRPREIDFLALKKATRGLKRSLRNVTIIRVNNPEAGPFADKLIAGLKKLHFAVDIEDVDGSRQSGVIVCRENAGDNRIGQTLRKAEIAAKIVPVAHSSSPDFCRHKIAKTAPPAGVFSLVGGTADAILTGSISRYRRGTVVFVGQKPIE
jgi:hypothetical protein